MQKNLDWILYRNGTPIKRFTTKADAEVVKNKLIEDEKATVRELTIDHALPLPNR